MQVDRKYKILDKDRPNIPVEFVILHYTAQSLKGSLDIFLGSKELSCHLLIDTDGWLYEMIPCWDGVCKKAFHAGKSFFIETHKTTERDQETRWESFNDFSIGIELVNENGNLFPFTDKQYQSLFKVLNHLKKVYPALNSETRILGHEHIAGFRGKKDPGFLFDWSLLFQQVYGKQKSLKSVLSKTQVQSLDFLKSGKNWNDKKAKKVSLILESRQAFWLQKLRLFFVHLFSSFQ